MLIALLTYKILRHMIHQKIALGFVIPILTCKVVCCLTGIIVRIIYEKTKFVNFHIKFLNSDFSVNTAQISLKFF